MLPINQPPSDPVELKEWRRRENTRRLLLKRKRQTEPEPEQ